MAIELEGNEDSDADEFLQEVGNLIRGVRARRGMTRKSLALDSSVSERYLANLEQGKGNISINLLRQVAEALNTPMDQLLPSSTRQTPEQALISELLSQLDRKEQQAALELLYQKFSSSRPPKSRIALIGLRGAGKTTLASLLQERLDIPLIRLADEIENLSGGMPISEIFSLWGQQGYRRLEERALFSALQSNESCCIETGGSIVSEPKTLNLLLTTCLVIWVRATPEDHMNRVTAQGDLRPMANNPDAMKDLEHILKERTPFYEQAHKQLFTSGKSVEQSFQELKQLIEAHNKVN